MVVQVPTIEVDSGGTGLVSLATGSLIVGNGTTVASELVVGSAGQILQVNSGGTNAAWSSNIAGVSGGRTVYGGTGNGDYLQLVSTSNATKGIIYFGTTLLSGYTESTGTWDLAFKGAGVRYLLSMANYNGSSAGSAGDGTGINFYATDAATTQVNVGRFSIAAEVVTAGAVSGSFSLDLMDAGTLRQVYKVDENANTHTWSLNNSTLLTLTTSLLTPASGVGISVTNATITVANSSGLSAGFTRSGTGASTVISMANSNTTDGNSVQIVGVTDTTGAGATAGVSLSAIRLEATTHDHATRAGAFDILLANGGSVASRLRVTPSLVTLASGVGLTLTSGTLTVTSGSAVLTSGNLTLTAGNATLTLGDLTLSAGRIMQTYAPADPASTAAGIGYDLAFSPTATAALSTAMSGLRSILTMSSAQNYSASSNAAIRGQAQAGGSGGTITNAVGVYGLVTLNNTSTSAVTSSRVFQGALAITGSASGTHTNAFVFSVVAPNDSGTITVTNGVGFDCADMSSARFTSSWGFRCQAQGSASGTTWTMGLEGTSGKSYVAGSLGIGATLMSAANKLEIVDSGAAQLRLSHTTTSKFWTFKVDTNSALTLAVNGSDKWVIDSSGNLAGTFGFTDITTGNVSTTAHGLVPKAPNIIGQVLREDGTWGYRPGFAYCTADRTNSTTTLTDITDLSVPLVASATYQFEAFLQTGVDTGTAGITYGVNFSAAGSTLRRCQIFGTTSSATAFRGEQITTLNTASGAFNTVASATGIVRIEGMITTGANAGNLTIQNLKVTSNTATTYTGSYLSVVRVA